MVRHSIVIAAQYAWPTQELLDLDRAQGASPMESRNARPVHGLPCLWPRATPVVR